MNPEEKAEVNPQRPGVVRTHLRVQEWEEETFELPMTQSVPASDEESVDPWRLEAVGAADDPSRFQVDLEDLQAGFSDVRP